MRRRGAPEHLRGTSTASGRVCASAPWVRPRVDARAARSWSYEVEPPAEGSRTVGVEATFDNARTDRLAIARESSAFVRDVQLKTEDGYINIERRGAQWYEPACA